MSSMMLEQNFVGTIHNDQRFLTDPQISIVKYYDCINDMAERWILELSKKDDAQIEQKIDSSKEISEVATEDEEQIVSLSVDDCCKRRSRR